MCDQQKGWLARPTTFCLDDLPRNWTVRDLFHLACPSASVDLFGYRVVLAIDAPLGFPIEFAQLLGGGAVDAPQARGREIENRLAYRDTDREVYRVFKKKPLSASFDKLGNNATVAMVHCRRLAVTKQLCVVPSDQEDGTIPTAIEVYPALIKNARYVSRFGALIPKHTTDPDALDAALCALLGLAYVGDARLPHLHRPAERQMDAARREGWIYYPV